MKNKDYVFQSGYKTDFVFDKSVTEVFDDMLTRSVPFYNEVQDLILKIIQHHTKEQEYVKITDLGCSLATTCFMLEEHLTVEKEIIGVDNSQEMIKKAEEFKKKKSSGTHMQFICGNMEDHILWEKLQNTNVFISALTLQFIRPLKRSEIIKKIYNALEPNGIFILFEKTMLHHPMFNRLFIDTYHEFKEKNGYTQTEIYNKRLALENILIPFSNEENRELLLKQGFKEIIPFFQYLNFSALVAIK